MRSRVSGEGRDGGVSSRNQIEMTSSARRSRGVFDSAACTTRAYSTPLDDITLLSQVYNVKLCQRGATMPLVRIQLESDRTTARRVMELHRADKVHHESREAARTEAWRRGW